MILHTVNKSPYSHQTLQDCLRVCQQQSSILFIEDGVLAINDGDYCTQLIEQNPHITFYALQADVVARGLTDTANPAVTLIDDSGFVDLVTQHHCVQSWF
jgi:tRNA 2-thiouridine synthesizing protein B